MIGSIWRVRKEFDAAKWLPAFLTITVKRDETDNQLTNGNHYAVRF